MILVVLDKYQQCEDGESEKTEPRGSKHQQLDVYDNELGYSLDE